MKSSYNQVYLSDAMEVLGSSIEYATMFCNIDGQEFIELFANSDIATEFEKGNAKYISGMSGIELALLILKTYEKPIQKNEEEMFADYAPEYWAGEALAYYQWYTAKRFSEICNKIPFKTICELYYPLHNEEYDEIIDAFNKYMET